MKLYVIVVYEEPLLDEILEGFVELGIGAVTVLDSHGIGNVLVTDDPIFAGFRDLARSHQYQKTILAHVGTEEWQQEVEAMLDEICDFDEHPEKGFRFTLPTAGFKGSPEVF